MSMEIPDAQIGKSKKPFNIATADSKILFSLLAFIIRPDIADSEGNLGKKHDVAVELVEAYKKAKTGDKKDLIAMYERYENQIADGTIDSVEFKKYKEELEKRKNSSGTKIDIHV